ncbi:hypothetical protein JL107_02390 [Nakamurella flavida]|uniref:PH domain-containing protein n=1 Tax=Nakamurella flavida TaxID=363630 RepID=A0A938YLV1_9ACTN|nr:hypothetical protein [Nakamurella flavida]MBM9475285.1 hypothetical protein [Nakamurella flavida]MDP9776859.1 hypothetical protein [Nakamurella flavida]
MGQPNDDLAAVDEGASAGERAVVDERILGRQVLRTRGSWWRFAGASAIVVCLIGYMVAERGWVGLIWIVFLVPGAVQRMIRPPTLVTRTGIRRRWRRPDDLYWSAVQGVAAPQRGVPMVRLMLNSGRPVDLEDIAAEHSAAVAALGGKEVLAPPRRTPPAARGGEVGDEQRELDVERRAARLAAERAEMRAREPRDR